MCGLAGFLRLKPGAADTESVIRAMTATLRHRGPDDSGTWVDRRSQIAIGHARLSIVDLSVQGHQPMVSSSGRYVLAYNGEIYNHLQIREDLERSGTRFRGSSDTEVLLEAVEEMGILETVKRCRGMFAFALWDNCQRRLVLARDRLGEKPLYFARTSDGLLFASELKAIRACQEFDSSVDRRALTLFMRYNYIPAPYTIYRDAFKLRPGTLLEVDVSAEGVRERVISYWSVSEIAQRSIRSDRHSDDEGATDLLDGLLRSSIKEQMVADVPLGAFLSGGIDSSTVVALMQAQSMTPVRTFTIGFHENAFNEAHIARRVAEHLGTDHAELYVTPQDAIDVIPRLPEIFDEPFADSSQIPTYLVSALTRESVTVSLSGDGGDELFGGYGRYASTLARLSEVSDGALSNASSFREMCRQIASAAFRRGAAASRRLANISVIGSRLKGMAERLVARDADSIYLGTLSHWTDPELVVIGGAEAETWMTKTDPELRFDDFRNRMMLLDTLAYLPDDILVKVDRAAMAVSLETRVPMLDHRIVEFAWSLPMTQKIRDGSGKWILRRVLERYVPKELFERPKMGFGVPIGEWLRGPLRDWSEALIDEKRLSAEGYLNPALVRQRWKEHLAGKANWQYPLWDVLMFQAWHARWNQ